MPHCAKFPRPDRPDHALDSLKALIFFSHQDGAYRLVTAWNSCRYEPGVMPALSVAAAPVERKL
jgi:hypothetical protein